MSRTVARTGLLIFAGLATVALIVAIALAKPPAPQEAAQLPQAGPADLSPWDPDAPAGDPAPAPTAEPSPAPSPAAEAAAPANAEDAPAEDTPAAPAKGAQPTPSGDTAPAEQPAPVSTSGLDVDGAVDYVRAFYADLERRDFHAAWPRLAEDLRKRHGSFEAWQRGFATTLSQSISGLAATAAGPATVRISLTLTAVDRADHDCKVTRRFAVDWRLDLMGGEWRALHAEGRLLEPAGVAASCSGAQRTSEA